MASKGQKFKKYSPEIKEKILKEYFAGNGGSKYLAKQYDISYRTIDGWIRKTKLDVDVRIDHRPGRSGKQKSNDLTLEDYKERYEILKKYQVFLKARREKK